MTMQLNLEEGKRLILYRYIGVNVKLTADTGGISPSLRWQKKDNLANSSQNY